MFMNLLYTEWIKIKKSSLFIILLISPMLSIVVGYFTMFDFGGNQWISPFFQMIMIHAVLFLPLLAGIFSAAVCRYEHAHGGWKQLLALPLNRAQIYVSKLLIICLFMALTQILFLLGLFLVGMIHGYTDPFPWEFILIRLAMGWLGCLPIISLQLWVSTAWASFAAPVALNVIFTLPNLLVANSEKFGPWYPWAQPFLGMALTDNTGFTFSIETLVFVILGSFFLFLIFGITYFSRKAM
ncbi:ABC transporter permease [Evansella sp. AB-rgal1]|uniref:ABC transporter permease n=1 Tax=Evansella sp. AB-rgal1 TaxID=3242696 RepID=UPI00359E5449